MTATKLAESGMIYTQNRSGIILLKIALLGALDKLHTSENILIINVLCFQKKMGKGIVLINRADILHETVKQHAVVMTDTN